MDFIKGLPNSFGNKVVFVVVDRLSKVGHFMDLSHPYTTSDVAQSYPDNVFQLNGFLNTITSDRDSILIGQFWHFMFLGSKFGFHQAIIPGLIVKLRW